MAIKQCKTPASSTFRRWSHILFHLAEGNIYGTATQIKKFLPGSLLSCPDRFLLPGRGPLFKRSSHHGEQR